MLCGSGSEVALALAAARLIEERDRKSVRVVSIPCLELLNESEAAYREGLFNNHKSPVVMIEAASHRGINFFYGKEVVLIDIETFGESAPGEIAAAHFGFTPEAVYKAIRSKL